MKSTNMTRGQVYSIGNYLMTGKVLGKGHFARVEEATHRTIGKKVAIKIIDLTCIKEDYARRNLHREPRVMARLRHPCIAALYETMMHGPRLYVVMEAAGGGDLCAHVLSSRGPARGLPEVRARALAAQLVSAVKHMHARGVVHRDLKMENIMLDTTKQFIKIVDFGLSNLWCSGGALRTPCGSLEYAAPELFVDGRRYGPEVDLWSIGVIVYGMVTGGLPFTSTDSAGEGKSKPQLRAAISRGFSRKQRAALCCVTTECKLFIEQLLEPSVDLRMRIEEAARHRWVRRAGMKMKTHPFATLDPKVNKEIYRQMSELNGQPVIDVIAQIKSDPFGAMGGIYNIKTHLHQMQAVPGTDLLWTSTQEPRPVSPPPYEAKYEFKSEASSSKSPSLVRESAHRNVLSTTITQNIAANSILQRTPTKVTNPKPATPLPTKKDTSTATIKSLTVSNAQTRLQTFIQQKIVRAETSKSASASPNSRITGSRPLSGMFGMKKPSFRSIQDDGDCCWDPRLPSIDEHSKPDVSGVASRYKDTKTKPVSRSPCVRRSCVDETLLRINSCPNKGGESKRVDFYRRAGDCLPSWRGSSVTPNPARLLLQSKATTIKRASLGNITSPHSSTNSHCKSEKSMPVGWYSTRTPVKEPSHLQRFRRTAPMK